MLTQVMTVDGRDARLPLAVMVGCPRKSMIDAPCLCLQRPFIAFMATTRALAFIAFIPCFAFNAIIRRAFALTFLGSFSYFCASWSTSARFFVTFSVLNHRPTIRHPSHITLHERRIQLPLCQRDLMGETPHNHTDR